MTQDYTSARNPRRAAYLYAGQAGTGRVPIGPADGGRASPPSWFNASDLDYLSAGNPYFHTDRALYSFGPHLHGSVPATMFAKRPGATILGDSGGFQFIKNPAAFRGDPTRHWVLTTLEHDTDEAMTLDIPTKAISQSSPWPDFATALAVTHDNLRYIDRHRVGKTRWLNVLQGRSAREAMTWYDAVKWFPAGGWAFGGVMRRDWVHVVAMLVRIEADGLLGPDRNRIHVLGVGDLTGAVMLSAIQRGMQERLSDPDFLITFDASSPSMMAGNRQAVGYPRLSASSWTVDAWSPPTIYRPGHPASPWPVRHTGVGALMTTDDLLVAKGGLSRTAWDGLSEALVCHHNVNAAYWAIDAANSVMELHPQDAIGLAKPEVIACYQALVSACGSTNPASYLRPYAAQFAKL